MTTIFVVSCMVKTTHNERNKLARSQWTNNWHTAVLILSNSKMRHRVFYISCNFLTIVIIEP